MIFFIACSLKDSQDLFMYSIPFYTSFFVSISLNDDIIDFQNPDKINSLNFAINNFLGSFLHLSILTF